MMTLTNTTAKIVIAAQQLDSINFRDSEPAYFLQEVLEGLNDGILILSETGELVHANASAYRFCCQLNQGNLNHNFVPSVISQLCEFLLKSSSLLADKSIILSEEIALDESNIFRVRVRLLDSERFQVPCLLVTIENQYESLKHSVLTEAKKFGLTQREAEIWVLYRSNYSYKDIATKLFITLNTVKKHMKNIHAKRQVLV
ncbi:LuxR family transcriptional regulator [Cylindrospermum sp. NIES-4074]|nr:LuxR family transcriptional regulator [Cylindrospermum sp. NIES-4074]